MKILFVLEYYHPHIGGVETLFKSLVDHLGKNGFSVTVLTNKYHNQLSRIEKNGSITIRRYSFINRYIFTLFGSIPTFFQALHHDVIHTTSYNAAVPAMIAGKLTGKKVIITFHEVWDDLWLKLPWMSGFSKILHRSFEKMILKLPFYKVVAVSKTTQERLLEAGVDPSRILTIPNGISYDHIKAKWESTKSKEFTFTFFGRLSYSKGVDILLFATSLLKERRDDFKIQLILSGEHTKLFKIVSTSIKKLSLEKIVHMLEPMDREDLHQTIADSDAVVIPSYSEGFCFAAVETMAIGTPIVSSAQGALSEVLSGQYIEMKKFDASSLAQAMYLAIEGQWQFKPNRKYSIEETVTSYAELYSQLIV